MADRVYPSTKPTTTPAAVTPAAKPTTNPTFPATKSQLYNASRPNYRPQPNHHSRHRRSRRCSCCICLLLTILILLLVTAIAGAVFYFLYSPHRPSFSVASLKSSQFNLTSSSPPTLLTKFNLTVTSSNPNKKLIFIYNPFTISVSTSPHNVLVGTGSQPPFVQGTNNITALHSVISTNNGELDAESTTNLRSDMKSKNGVRLKIEMDTKVKVKIGGMTSRKFQIRILCEGIKVAVPIGKTPATATVSDHKCKVDLRIKIWQWTF